MFHVPAVPRRLTVVGKVGGNNRGFGRSACGAEKDIVTPNDDGKRVWYHSPLISPIYAHVELEPWGGDFSGISN